jgi:hypothetical protein
LKPICLEGVGNYRKKRYTMDIMGLDFLDKPHGQGTVIYLIHDGTERDRGFSNGCKRIWSGAPKSRLS